MADKPMIFSAPMVRALLSGSKTQTRRKLPAVHPKHPGCTLIRRDVLMDPLQLWFWDGVHENVGASHPVPYAPGDRLYVKEAWSAGRSLDHLSPAMIADRCLEAGYRRPWAPILYEAEGFWVNYERGNEGGRSRASIHMPRWASRLTLTVTDVRVQRVQEISEADAVAEGAQWEDCWPTYRQSFEALWASIHGPDAWDANPWVCAITFTVERRNIDA